MQRAIERKYGQSDPRLFEEERCCGSDTAVVRYDMKLLFSCALNLTVNLLFHALLLILFTHSH